MVSHDSTACPECESILEVPSNQQEGVVTCDNCDSSYMFGRNQQKDEHAIEMANKYALFVTPAMIALNEKVLEFNELYPDNGLFDEETLEKTRATILDLKQMLEEEEEEEEED